MKPEFSSKPKVDRNAIRVAFFSDAIPERNGAGSYYYDLIQHIAPSVAALEVFQPKEREKYGFFTIPLAGDSSQRLVAPNIIRIDQGYRQLNPHIVVSVTPGPFGLLGLYYAWRSGAGFVSGFHTDFEKVANEYWQKAVRLTVQGYFRLVNTVIYRNSHAVLVNNSKLTANIARIAPQTPIKVIGTPVHSAFLNTPIYPIGKTLRQVCYVGRLATEKNVDKIISVAPQFPEIRFLIVGTGPMQKQLEKMADGMTNVRFTGWLNRRDLGEVLDRSELLILPSKFETFGSVALEAMARGRLALVTPNVGIYEWKDLHRGLIFMESPDAIGKSLRELQKLSPAALQERSRAARQDAQQLHHHTLRDWLSVLENYARPQ
jgi:glycosyltransferase involved in cell wall biosynthesis